MNWFMVAAKSLMVYVYNFLLLAHRMRQRQMVDRVMSKIVTMIVMITNPHPKPPRSVTVTKDLMSRYYCISRMLIVAVPKGLMPQTKNVKWLLSEGISRTVGA